MIEPFDSKRTVVVSNFPVDVGEDELTIHFQKEKNGGGDVDKVVMDGSVAFVIFDFPEVATSILNRLEQVINETKIEVQSYELWSTSKKGSEFTQPSADFSSSLHFSGGAIKTICVSGIKDSTTTDTIVLYFRNKRRTGGGELCEGGEGFERLSPTEARLRFVSSKDAQSVLKKAEETLLKLEGNVLTVSPVLEPTHDQSILLVNNLNPKTSKETVKDFIEVTKNADVFEVIFEKDGKAIVILKNEIDEDFLDVHQSSCEELEGFVVSLEFAPLTKGIMISNIPPDTSYDAMRFKFSNPKIGGGKVTQIMLDTSNGMAVIYFEKSSVVSHLVKQKHAIRDVALTVIPYYDDFEELEKKKTKTSLYSGDYSVDPLVMRYIMNTQELDKKFDFESIKFDQKTSRFHFQIQFGDPKDATVFQYELKDFLQSFVKEEIKIPKAFFKTVKEEIESKRDEFEADKVEFMLDGLRVTLVGKKESVFVRKQSIEVAIDRVSKEVDFVSVELMVDNKNKVKFLNFIDYFKNVMTEFPGVQIRGMERLLISGTREEIKDVQLKFYQDVMRISEISVKMSIHQLDFLERTQCKIVNDELKKDDAMLLLIDVGFVGAKVLQARIMSLKKFDDDEEQRLLKIVDTKTSQKCITVDEETATFLSKSNKLQKFKKEQFDKHQVLIDPELDVDPCNIWIVCEKSKISDTGRELTSLTVGSSTFRPLDAMKVRFLKKYRWGVIKEKEKSYKAEGVTVSKDIYINSFEVKGTLHGRVNMIMFLEELAGNVVFKTYSLYDPGMKKQMSMDTTDLMISDVEKNYKCVIQKGVPSEETEKKTEAPTFVADGGSAAGTSGPSTMNLPYHSMSFVNDKEVKLASGQRITIVVGDLAQETVDVIVNTTNDKVDLNANPCGKALLKVAGNELLNECKKIGSLQAGEMASTGPANLNCKRVFHVRSSSWYSGNGTPILRQIIQKCLDQLEKDKLTSIAIPAIGTGNLHFPRPEVAKVFFEEVTSFLTAHPQSAIDDVRFVAYGKDQATVDAFLGAIQEIKCMILSPVSKTNPVAAPGPVPSPKRNVIPTSSCHTSLVKDAAKAYGDPTSSSAASSSYAPEQPAKTTVEDEGIFFKIYCDDRGKLDNAWVELKRKMKQNIGDRTICDAIIKRFADDDVDKVRKLEREFDFEIKVDQAIGEVRFRGHILDIPNVQEKIIEVLKDIKFWESKVPAYWVKTTDERKYHKFTLLTDSREYKNVEAAFHATVPNQIVSIDRIQNREIYELYNVTREAMIMKYGTNFPGKEVMLFHATSCKNIEKINARGLNRSNAEIQSGTVYGRGVYFARDARYSCDAGYFRASLDISGRYRPHPQELRYMYFVRVLVGDYTNGKPYMIVAPNKSTSNPNETYDSVVDNVADPNIYVLFGEYEYYPEYLITFR